MALSSDDGNHSAFSNEYEDQDAYATGPSRIGYDRRSNAIQEEDVPTPRSELPKSPVEGYFGAKRQPHKSRFEEAPLLSRPRATPSGDYGAVDDGHKDVRVEENKNMVPGEAAMEAVGSQWSSLRTHMRAMASAARRPRNLETLVSKARELTWSDVRKMGMQPIHQIPAVILGVLLNVLDGVSYGMIMFPTSNPLFADFGGDGVSMFFMTCIISQLVYTCGGSIFKGGNGSMMIEVVPFYHILVQVITKVVGEKDGQAVVATTMVAFALSSVFTGLAFLLLGVLRLGVIISYFPRHILVGCIGGVGVFLIETGLAVAGRIEEDGGFKYNGATLAALTESWAVIAQWTIPLALAFLLSFITTRIHHPLVFPGYFLAIPIVFYAVSMGVFGMNMQDLRDHGWVFDVGRASDAPFYRYFSYFDLRSISWEALWATLPTQLALVFFGILHVPLNVPALGVSVNEDNVDTDRELIAHGVSNVAAGFLGTVPNYLCYVNSVLFYRVGGGSRLSGLMLAAVTTLIMLLGPGMIAFLPIMVVGALIFVLGIDLVREALFDTIGRVNRLEYLTIAVIIVVMTCSDFVVGSLVGIMLACLFFVMQTSRKNAVRSVFNGHAARSTVRRHMTQRRFLEQVGHQTLIFKLQGSLFFGTINSVEQLIRKMLDIATWKQNPIRFLIMDLTQVNSMDFSAAEAMTRIHRMLSSKSVILVLCGVKAEGDVGTALQNVDLWTDLSMHLEVFASLNEALEWTENEFLRSMYSSGLSAGQALGQASLSNSAELRVPKRKPVLHLDDGFANSPRYNQLHEAAKTATYDFRTRHETSPVGARSRSRESSKDSNVDGHALSLLVSTLGPYTDDASVESAFKHLVPELKELELSEGTVLWERDDTPDACTFVSTNTVYFIESGILKARYVFPQDNYEINEAMLAGTIAGELSFLSQQKRNSTVTVEKDAKVWRLDGEALQSIEQHHTRDYAKIIQTLLRVTADEHDCLMSYLVSRLS